MGAFISYLFGNRVIEDEAEFVLLETDDEKIYESDNEPEDDEDEEPEDDEDEEPEDDEDEGDEPEFPDENETAANNIDTQNALERARKLSDRINADHDWIAYIVRNGTYPY